MIFMEFCEYALAEFTRVFDLYIGLKTAIYLEKMPTFAYPAWISGLSPPI